MAKSKAARRAYSYVRFSSPQQAEGGSVTRQTRMRDDYIRRKGLTLDTTLTLSDLGVSAFRGDNINKGALAGFLEACRTKRVPEGSVLIVESLDRLSRDQIRPALNLFNGLLDKGITIVTLEPEREYNPDNNDPLALIEPLIIFARAHEESAMKSHRRRDGWRQARDRARQGKGPMLKTGPAWLEVVGTGEGEKRDFRIKEEAAAAVRRIFALSREGMGVHRITAKLIADKVPPIGSKGEWCKVYVQRILTSPAAMGTYQPQKVEGKTVVPDGEPIPGYYPAVVTEADWEAAQAAIGKRARDNGLMGRFVKKEGEEKEPKERKRPFLHRQSGADTNLFTGIIKDALTGNALHIVNAKGRKGTDGKQYAYSYLCPTQETGATGGQRIDNSVFERAIFSALQEIKPDDIAPKPAQEEGRRARITALSGKLLDIDARLERAKQRAKTADDYDTFLDLIEELTTDRRRISEERAELEEEEESRSPADLGEAQTLIGLLAEATAEERADLRRRLKARIRQLIASVDVVVTRQGATVLCEAQLSFRGGDRCRKYLIIHKPGTRYGPGRLAVRSILHPEAAEAGLPFSPEDLRDKDQARNVLGFLEAFPRTTEEANTRDASALARFLKPGALAAHKALAEQVRPVSIESILATDGQPLPA